VKAHIAALQASTEQAQADMNKKIDNLASDFELITNASV
jgi:hypothetical protein